MICHWQSYDLDYIECIYSVHNVYVWGQINILVLVLVLVLVPTTSAMVFLSFFYPAPPSPSLTCPHILHIFSMHAHTTSTYFHCFKHFIRYSSHHRCPSYSFIYNSVQLSSLSMARHRTPLLFLQLSCLLLLDSQTYYFGRTESPIPSSSLSNLIVLHCTRHLRIEGIQVSS